jgi:hypothetical protein
MPARIVCLERVGLELPSPLRHRIGYEYYPAASLAADR